MCVCEVYKMHFAHLGVPNTVDVYPFSGHPNAELYIKSIYVSSIILETLNFSKLVLNLLR